MCEVVDTLKLLQQQGKIRAFGLSNIKTEDIQELYPFRGSFSTVQNQYSLACRDQEASIGTLCESLSATLLTWGSLGQGILTGKYDKTVSFGSDDRRSRRVYENFHGEKLLKNLEIVEVLKEIAAQRQKPVSAVAVRFILDHLQGSVVLCGAKRPQQILDNAQALGWQLCKEEISRLDRISG